MPLSAQGVQGTIFNRLIRTAATAGVLAGLLLTGVQHLQVTSIIGAAEVLETAAEAQPAAAAEAAHAQAHAAGAEHTHAVQQTHATNEAHEHGGWEPEDGVERTLYTALADVSMAVGFGLLLAAAIALRGKPMTWRSGALWGAAGYAVFFLAPSLGLPPELPGTAAAPVILRQGWWLSAAGATAAGIALLVFGRHWALKALGVALLFVPHLVGAPQPPVHAGLAPADMVRAFIYATALANAVFWLALGALTGYFYQRYA